MCERVWFACFIHAFAQWATEESHWARAQCLMEKSLTLFRKSDFSVVAKVTSTVEKVMFHIDAYPNSI